MKSSPKRGQTISNILYLVYYDISDRNPRKIHEISQNKEMCDYLNPLYINKKIERKQVSHIYIYTMTFDQINEVAL